MALQRAQTYLIAKYAVITFTTLTLIATFVGYGVVIREIDYLEEQNHRSEYWRSWRSIIIVYLVIEDITALVGLFGAIKENYRLTLSYGIVMTILWFFNFANRAMINANVFNYLISLCVIFSAFYFAKRIRQNQILGSQINYPPIGQTSVFVTPAQNVIHVSESYIPNQSTVHTVHYQNQNYTTAAPEPASTPPPPYSNAATQPQLQFKY